MKTWWFKDIRNIFFVIGVSYILCSLFCLALMKMDVTRFYMVQDAVTTTPVYDFVFAPISEEFLFRWLPITFMIRLMKGRFENVQWLFACLVSIVFGVAHYGYFSIYIQGIFGLGACYLYYKNRYGFLSAVLCHAIWNIQIGLILPMIN